MKKHYLFILLLVLLSNVGWSQAVLQTESFESATIFPAPGWKQQTTITNISANFSLQIAGLATNPACGASPGGGVNLMMLNSFSANLNDTVLMITKPFDFSNNGGVNPFFRFYMYRDNGFLATNDRIRVYINTAPSLTGATLLTNTVGVTDILRRNNGAPVAVANTWTQYTYNLPAATYNGKRYYFIIMGICGDGNNIYIDQVQTNTYPSPTNSADMKMNMFAQNTQGAVAGWSNYNVVGLRCIIGGNSGCGYIDATPALTTALKMDSLLLNTNGTTNLADIDDAKIYYTGGSAVFDTTYVSPFPATAGFSDYPSKRFGQTIAVPGTNLDFVNGASSCFFLEYDTTYFWLTYDVKSTATAGNSLDAELRSASAGGPPASCPSAGGTGISVVPSPGGNSINGAGVVGLPYCVGQYTFGTSYQNGSYTNNDYIQSVILNGASGSSINTASGVSNNNTGLPGNLPCLASNGGPGCDFTAHPSSYELWPNIPGRSAALTVGSGYTVSVQAGTFPTWNNIAVFIDYNRDGDFNDVFEKLGQVTLNANQSSAIPFVVPASVIIGNTIMRVREVRNISNIDACAQYDFGEIEDFYVSIVPNCPVGYKLWLGNSDDWSSSLNWCGGVPAITDDVKIDRAIVFPPAGIPTVPYYSPVIKSSVAANCNNLTISNLDTLTINAPTPATDALKIRRDLTNNGLLRVISGYSTQVTYGSGALSSTTSTPFKATATDARTQIIYSAAELQQAGLIAGDKITGLQFTVTAKGSLSPYNGFTVSYALVSFATQFTSATPNNSALTTVYGPVAYSTVAGLNTINLNTPIVWDGINSILVQYCYNNTSTTGASNDVILYTQTTGIGSTLNLSTTSNVLSGCALTAPLAGVSDNFFAGTKSYRPNFTFNIVRPYSKVNINVQEDWINNNSFIAGYSRVEFDSTITNNIGGSQNTTFNELLVNKGAANQYVTLQRPTSIDSSLVLAQGSLLMNSFPLTMNNNASSGGTINAPTGPFARTNGFLISESADAKVIWKNLNSTGWRIIPFGNSATVGAPVYIPYSVQLVSFTNPAGLGDFSVSTFYSSGNSVLPPGVSHLFNTSGVNNAANTVDRFWMVSKTASNLPSAPVANLTFRFAGGVLPTERPTGMSVLNPGRLQPYVDLGTTEGWLRLTPPVTTANYHSAMQYGTLGTYDSVRVLNWNWPDLPASTNPFYPAQPIGNAHPWTITSNNAPCGLDVQSPIVAILSVTPESCVGTSNGSITISVTGSSGPFTYLWSNGSANMNITNLGAGTYTVTVTDANGMTASTSATVTISNTAPQPLSPILGPGLVCIGTPTTFTVPPSSGASSYNWILPLNATLVSGQGSPIIVVNFSAAFTSGNICVTASNACGTTAAVCYNVTGSTGIPATPGTITGTGNGVCNQLRTYTVPAVSNVVYNWTTPSGASIVSGQGSNSISVQFSNNFTSGNISVVAGNGCGNSNARTKTVYGKPLKPTVINGPQVICGNTTATYSTNSIFGASSYTWTVPAGVTILSGQGTTSIIVSGANAAATGDVCVKASNSCGTTSNYCKTITITPSPNAIATITGSGYGVCGATKTYSVPAQSGINFTWSVTAGAVISGGQGTNSVSVTFNSTFGNGNISVTASSSCGTPVIATKVINGKPLTPTAITGQATICYNLQNASYNCSAVSGASTYTWTVPPGVTIVSGQGTTNVVLNFNGTPGSTIQLKVKSGNSCGQSGNRLANISLLNCPRVELASDEHFNLYPNPASEEFTVTFNSEAEQKTELQILNPEGQLVMTPIILSGSGSQQYNFSTSSLADGVYFVLVKSSEGILGTQKLIIQH